MAVQIAILTALGCNDGIGPTSGGSLSPNGPAFSASDNSEWTYASSYVDYVRTDVTCLGEAVRFFGGTPYRYHQVTSNAGEFHYHLQFVPQTPNIQPFVGIGLSTGRVFTYKNGGPYNETYHLGAGEVFTSIAHETYGGSDGTTLRDTQFIHITVNANGTITANRLVPVSFTCS